LLFGCGLIGNSIARQLEREGFVNSDAFRLKWNDTDVFQTQLLDIERHVKELQGLSPSELHLVWSAGRGGFASSEQDLEGEKNAFSMIISLFRNLSHDHAVAFHFLSSAGGLFEGQTLVNHSSEANPQRPYGVMKWQQEQLLEDIATNNKRQINIYRPSTVYGSHDFGQRRGLVSHLIWNALRNVPTTLESNIHSLRDYVFVEDIGCFITNRIHHGFNKTGGIFHLVSAKPSSIFEVSRKIQILIGRSILYQHCGANRNQANITFDHQLLPEGWTSIDFGTGLGNVLRITKSSFLKDLLIR
jgi:nucleoside-diphosphate-sugar epimerase